jgi:hypothetical protein
MTDERLSKAEQIRALHEVALAFPLYFSDPVIIGRHPDIVGEDDAQIYSASATYLELPSRKLAITNAHVVRKLEEERGADPTTIFQLGDRAIHDVEDRIVDVDDAADLATIDVSDITLSNRSTGRIELRPRQFHRPASWPPAVVSEGDVILSGGWPGALRRELDGVRHLEHNPYSIAAVAVTLAMPDRFRVRLDRGQLTTAFGERGWDEKDFDFGGMSGAPVFRKRELIYELIGIVSEYREPPYDTFAVTNAANIKSDGTLWHNVNR